ncbi:endonuclease/exonuclease/phosphatase family protein [Kribbella sp. NPDC059898]|uniref:endonuclease/exonuclease/phosphatase family protein n=1 Tax=Kribbella sp. NPDC059898 TaxID=3346995 RepID=UPI00365F50A7
MPPRLTLVTLNTRGLPLPGTRISERYAAVAAALDPADVDVICLQEVNTYRHVSRLRRGFTSFPYVMYGRGPAGPAGGLVTLSRLPCGGPTYTRLPQPVSVPLRSRLNALHSGVLTVELREGGLRVHNVHPMANTDGDWSAQNRFHRSQGDQLRALAAVVRAPAVVCGDFNVSRDSVLYDEFRVGAGVRDAFNGDCPPTFHAEYLPPGSSAHCIDFIFVTEPAEVSGATVLFSDKVAMPSGPGHVSDHLGLRAVIAG